MTKIENSIWFSDVEIRQGNRRTLEVIIKYLRSKNVKVYAFIEIDNRAVIIKYKGLICQFRTSSQACKYLYDIYKTLAEEDKRELIRRQILKDNSRQLECDVKC